MFGASKLQYTPHLRIPTFSETLGQYARTAPQFGRLGARYLDS